MNLNRQEVNKKFEDLKRNITKLGATLIISPEAIHENRQNVLWYNGVICKINYKDFTILINAGRQAKANLYKDGTLIESIRNKNNENMFFDKLSPYIKNDLELEEILKNSEILKSRHNKQEGLFLELIEENQITYSVYDNQTETYIKLPVDIEKTEDVTDALNNIKSYFIAINEHSVVKEQAEKLREIIEEGRSVLIIKKIDSKIRCVSIKKSASKAFYITFRIYDGFCKSGINPKTINDIFGLIKSFSYQCPTQKKFISECSSLVPTVVNNIILTNDINKEFNNFINSNENIAIISGNFTEI